MTIHFKTIFLETKFRTFLLNFVHAISQKRVGTLKNIKLFMSFRTGHVVQFPSLLLGSDQEKEDDDDRQNVDKDQEDLDQDFEDVDEDFGDFDED